MDASIRDGSHERLLQPRHVPPRNIDSRGYSISSIHCRTFLYVVSKMTMKNDWIVDHLKWEKSSLCKYCFDGEMSETFYFEREKNSNKARKVSAVIEGKERNPCSATEKKIKGRERERKRRLREKKLLGALCNYFNSRITDKSITVYKMCNCWSTWICYVRFFCAPRIRISVDLGEETTISSWLRKKKKK